MSDTPNISAVARRRAARADNSSTPESLQTFDNAVADISPHAPASVPSLKRKTSARSLKQGDKTEPPGSSGHRKKIKASGNRLAAGAFGQEAPALLSQRAYSPSRPLVASSDEGEEASTGPGNTDPFVPPHSGRWDVGYDQAPTRAEGGSRAMLRLVEGQNSFLITPDQALSLTGRCESSKVLLLNNGDFLPLMGSMQLMVLQGSIKLLGVPLSPSTVSHRVFAPRSHPIPVLQAFPQQNQTPTEERSNPEPNIASRISCLPAAIRQCVIVAHAVVVIQELATGVECLGQIAQPFTNIFEPDPRDSNHTEPILKGVYAFKVEPRLDASFFLPGDWESALDSITSSASNDHLNELNGRAHDAPIILVKGGKNSGKSTFSRTLASCLTNRYRRVAFIECDIGQSEFTPGGMVTLNVLTAPMLGPPFTHFHPPWRAHFVGGTSPKTSPSYYLSCLSDLAQRYLLDLRYSTAFDGIAEADDLTKDSTVIPLVINTQGWVKGMGADLLRSIEDLFVPTHIVEFQLPQIPPSSEPPPDRSTLTASRTDHDSSNTSGHLIKLLPIPPPLYGPRFSAAELRSLALASYFYGRTLLPSNENGDPSEHISSWDASLSLRNTAPVAIDIQSALESIVITAPGGNDVVAEELPRALVCGVVGLVGPDVSSTPSGIPYVQGALPPSPQHSRCIGLGFIRGASGVQLQLLTPIPVSQLRSCRSIVLGELSMPAWAFFDPNGGETEDSALPFLQWGRSIAEDAGGGRRRIRRNVMRRGHF